VCGCLSCGAAASAPYAWRLLPVWNQHMTHSSVRSPRSATPPPPFVRVQQYMQHLLHAQSLPSRTEAQCQGCGWHAHIGAVMAFAAAADGAGGGTAASGAGSAWFCGCARSGGSLPGAAASAAAPAAPLSPCPGPPLEPGGPAAPRGSIAPPAAAALVGGTAGAAGSACAAVRAGACSSPRPLSAALPRWTAAAAAVAAIAAAAAAGWLVAVCVPGV